MKPIKVKKLKGCPGCINFNGRACKLTKKDVPVRVFNGNEKCSMRKKNKFVFF